MLDNELEIAGHVLWLMGPTSSGKTTLGRAVTRCLRRRGLGAVHYDGDEVRSFFGPDYGFSAADRFRVVQTLVHLANKAAGAGLQVVVSALTAAVQARIYVNDNTINLLVGHVSCPIDLCARRDPKGLYQRAAKGEIESLIGFNTPYLPPQDPDIVVDTAALTVDQGVELLEASLLARIGPGPLAGDDGNRKTTYDGRLD